MNANDPNANRPGYKETKVGWIPEEWEVKELVEVAVIQTGLAKGKNGEDDFVTLPYLRVANVQDGHIFLDEVKSIAVQRKDIDRFSLRPNDVLFTEGGDFDKLGRGCVWHGQIEPCLHQNHVFAVRCKSKSLLPYLLACYAASAHGRRYFTLNSKQSTNLASINSTQLKAFPVFLPPIHEQQKIAAILSTCDEAIEKTGELIKAKQRQKKALMQQLLTGKKRLPGFGEKWKFPKAEEVFERINRRGNGSDPVLSVTQDFGVIDRTEVGKRIDYDESNTQSYKLIEPNDFVISLRSFQGGLEISNLRGLVSPAYHVIRSCKPCCHQFYKYYFKSFEFIGRLDIAVIGIRDGKQVSYEDFSFLKIPYPPVEEQSAIADLLSKADSEITLLEAKKSALQQQKKALMQKLLTGQVRVKV